MNKRVIDVYEHYKSLYGSVLLLFRVRNNYEAYFDDAKNISKLLNIPLHTEESVCLPASNVLDMLEQLPIEYQAYKLIQQRNDTGVFDLPDLSLMSQEKLLDY